MYPIPRLLNIDSGGLTDDREDGTEKTSLKKTNLLEPG